MDLHPRGLKSGINFPLEPEWTYNRVGLYSSFYGNLRTSKKQRFITNQMFSMLLINKEFE